MNGNAPHEDRKSLPADGTADGVADGRDDDCLAGEPPSDFEREAAEGPPSLLAEYWDFLVHNKKWWLTPIVILILLAGLLVILAGSLGPFIYPGL